ncbi:acyl-CoA dehydrogenase family protein [Tsuneonella amylolytica]|uniref:acyl-CoA dehydrogenase family protein n=1 Tax=Tsuneonella amylolytica TaxID=2338327 RepID=UPI000EAAC48A|nr:acyl-CoA dehydrogenase family protein [Tsuneonella amylolytica]
MDRSELAQPFERMIAGLFPPGRVREGNGWDAERREIEASGFLDLLAGDDALAFDHAVPLFIVLGRHAAPLGIGREMIARGGLGDGAEAILLAAAIAGAGERVLEMAVAYANDRVQFGKPIGKQQAVQQNLALMAEHVVAVRLAAELAAADFPDGGAMKAAVAKATASELAPRIASAAHAVCGAMGIGMEHDLQLFTRRLHQWRAEAGSETLHSRALGIAVLADDRSAVDWVRAEVFREA